MKKSNLKAYIRRFDAVFKKALHVINEIEEEASEISAELMKSTTIKVKKDSFPMVFGSFFIVKNIRIPLHLSVKGKAGETAHFDYEDNAIRMFGINPRLEAIKNFSKNFRWVESVVHEIVHAFQHNVWGPKLNKLKKSERKGVEIEASVFSVPIALAIFMVRGNPFSREDYEEFIQRLIFVQTGYPYFRMAEVRNAILKNKEFIWGYANELRVQYTDYCPTSRRFVGRAS